ncbi:hypothetical protein IAT40_002293 [Kwoniella sp. CBS 6097]
MISFRLLTPFVLCVAFLSLRSANADDMAKIILDLGESIELFGGWGDTFDDSVKGPSRMDYFLKADGQKQILKFRIVVHDAGVPRDEWTRHTRRWLLRAVAGAETKYALAPRWAISPREIEDWLQAIWVPQRDSEIDVWSLESLCVKEGGCGAEQPPRLGKALVSPA